MSVGHCAQEVKGNEQPVRFKVGIAIRQSRNLVVIPDEQLSRKHCLGCAQIVQWVRKKSGESEGFARREEAKGYFVSFGG